MKCKIIFFLLFFTTCCFGQFKYGIEFGHSLNRNWGSDNIIELAPSTVPSAYLGWHKKNFYAEVNFTSLVIQGQNGNNTYQLLSDDLGLFVGSYAKNNNHFFIVGGGMTYRFASDYNTFYELPSKYGLAGKICYGFYFNEDISFSLVYRWFQDLNFEELAPNSVVLNRSSLGLNIAINPRMIFKFKEYKEKYKDKKYY